MGEWQEVRHQVAIAGKVVKQKNNQPLNGGCQQKEEVVAGARVRIVDAPKPFVDWVITKAQLITLPNEPEDITGARSTLRDPAVGNPRKLEAADKIFVFLKAHRAFSITRPDQKVTAPDGSFYFLDLPDGEYKLIASLPGSGKRYGISEEVTAKVPPENGDLFKFLRILLPITTLQGRVTKSSATSDSDDDDSDKGIILAAVQIKGSQERTFSNRKGNDHGYYRLELEASPQPRTIQVSATGYKSVEKVVTVGNVGEIKTLDFELLKSQ